MIDTLFNPMGRIGPGTFRNAALILIAVGAALSLMPLLLPALWMVSLASMLLLYPWAVIWVKRFHDAGKSGKWFFAVLALLMIASLTANHFITSKLAPPPPQPGQPVDIAAMMQAQILATALPATIIAVVLSLAVALIINEELKSDPGENPHGPPPTR